MSHAGQKTALHNIEPWLLSLEKLNIRFSGPFKNSQREAHPSCRGLHSDAVRDHATARKRHAHR
jgi:hypothetical protein